MAGRVSQLPVEAVIASTSGNARVSQHPLEAIIAPTSQKARVSQAVVETVVAGTQRNARVSQAVVEVVIAHIPKGTFGVESLLVEADVAGNVRRFRWADAVILAPQPKTFSVAAEIVQNKTGSFDVSAQIGGYARIDAIILGSVPKAFTVDYRWGPGGNLGLNAVVLGKSSSGENVLGDVALGKPVAVSSTYSGTGADLVDGNDATEHHSSNPVTGQWKYVDLGVPRRIVSLRFLQTNVVSDASHAATTMVIESSADASAWTVRSTYSSLTTDQTLEVNPSFKARYWRIRATAGGGNGWRTYTLSLFAANLDPFLLDAHVSKGHFTLDAWLWVGDANIEISQTGLEAARTGIPNVEVSQAGYEVAYEAPKGTLTADAVISFITHPEASFKADALIAGYFYLDAWLWTGNAGVHISQFGIERGRTNPSPNLWVSQAGFEVARTGWNILWVSQIGYEVAYEKPKGTFTAASNIYRPGDLMTPVTFTVDAELIFTFFVNAAIIGQGAGSFTARAVLVLHIEDSFAADADILLGFLVDAVRFARLEKFFYVYSRLVVTSIVGSSFSASAWKHAPHSFAASAVIKATKAGTFTAGAALIIAGTPIRSTTLEATIGAPETSSGFLAEAFIWSEHTVVYEGYGSTRVVRNLITERLSFPGFANPVPGKENLAFDDSNNVYGPFRIIDFLPVTVTLWEKPSYEGYEEGVTQEPSLGIHSVYENMWYWPTGPSTYVFWPSYYLEDHYVYAWHNHPYDPTFTGSGMVSYYRDDTVVDALPAPTLDAWIVGTKGTPWTMDAEIVGREKTGSFTADADLMKQGEVRGRFDAGAHLLAPRPFAFPASAFLADKAFAVDALIHQPHFTLDAHVHNAGGGDASFPLDAVRFAGWSKSFKADAVKVRLTREGSFFLDADIPAAGEARGTLLLDATIKTTKASRFYLVSIIASLPSSFTVGAVIAGWITLEAWIGAEDGGLGSFPVGAYVRGSSYIIFPDDGGAERVITDGVLNSTTTLTSATANFTFSDTGRSVSGVGIPAGTVIVSVIDSTTVIMSNAATVSASGVVVTIGRGGPTDPLGNPPALARKFAIKIEAGFPQEMATADPYTVIDYDIDALLCIPEDERLPEEEAEIARLRQLIADQDAMIAAARAKDPAQVWLDRLAHVSLDINRYYAIHSSKRTAQINDALARAWDSYYYAATMYRRARNPARTWVDITGDVIWSGTQFAQQARTGPGTFTITLKGAQVAFKGGEEIHFEIDGLRVFGGWVADVQKDSFFADYEEPRTTLHGTDYNILFDRIMIRNYPWEFATYGATGDTSGLYRSWPPFKKGTMDDAMIRAVFSRYVAPDLPPEFNWTDGVDAISTPAPIAPWVMPEAGSTLRSFMQSISMITTGVWWIDPYMVLQYHDRGKETAPFPLTDGQGGISSRGLRVTTDISNMINDILVWGTLAKDVEGDIMYFHETGDGEWWEKYWISEIERIFAAMEEIYEIPPGERTDAEWDALERYKEQLALDKQRLQYVRERVWDPYSGEPRPADAQIDSVGIWGFWQHGEFREDIHHMAWLRKRGHSILVRWDEPVMKASATVWDPGYQAGQVVNVKSSVYGIDLNLVIRSLRISFTVAKEPVGGIFYALPQYDLDMGLDPEGPWNIYDFLPYPGQGTPGLRMDTTGGL